MGLIRAAVSSVRSGLGDQFKEFVTCPEMDKNVIIQRGKVEHGKGNKNFSEGVISNGSGIVVPEGMAMMIIDNGEIKEFTSEAGTYTYDTSSEPSIFVGNLGEGIKNTIKTGFLLMPSCSEESQTGALEDLCWKIMTDKHGVPIHKEVVDFIESLKRKRKITP